MPYIAQRQVEGGGAPILTPEEEALLAAEGEDIPPPDTSMYAAPVDAQYQPGGENYVAPYSPQQPSGALGFLNEPTGDPSVMYAQSQPTDPYNTAPSGTYPSDPIPAPATRSAPYTPSYPSSSDTPGSPLSARDGGNPSDPDQAVSDAFLPGGSQPRTGAPLTTHYQGWNQPMGAKFNRQKPPLYKDALGQYFPGSPEAFGELDRGTRWAPERTADAIPPPATSSDPLGTGNILTNPSDGLYWDQVLNPQLPKPEPYRNEDGRMVLGGGDMMFMPGPVGGAAAGQAANLIDDAARVGANVTDDAARAAGTVADDAARAGSALDDAKAIPEPNLSPRSQQALNAAKPRTAEEIAQTANVERVKKAYTEGVNSRRAGTGRPSNVGTNAATPDPPVVPPSGGSRSLPAKRLAALLGAGTVVGGVLAANRAGGGETPADVPQPKAGRQPLEPGVYNPSTNPQSGADWDGASTRSLELMKSYSPADWTAGTRRAPVEIDGVPRKLIESTARPGLYVGYVDAAGNVVPVGNDVPAETFVELVTANAAEAPPDWGDVAPPSGNVATPTAEVPTPAASGNTTISDVSIDAPSDSGGGSSWNDDWSSGSGSRSGKRSSWDDFDNAFDGGREFTADDFLDAADGDYDKAERMARMANKRRKRKGSRGSDTGSGFWDGFPFNRPPTPMREYILTAIAESKAAGQARKQQR